MQYVRITSGPDWALGLIARFDPLNYLMTFTNPVTGSKCWYSADAFQWEEEQHV